MVEHIHLSHTSVEKANTEQETFSSGAALGKEIKEWKLSAYVNSDSVQTHTFWPGTLREETIIVDYDSRFSELERLYNCTSAAVISELKSTISKHRIAETKISGDGRVAAPVSCCAQS